MSFLLGAVSGAFGGLAVRYVDYFFKSSSDRLEKLEKAYLCTSSIKSFTNQNITFVALFIYCETNKLSKDILGQIKVAESPIPQLNLLLNFHLDAPREILSQLQSLEGILIQMTKPMAAPLIQKTSVDEMHKKSIEQQLQARELSVKVQSDLQEWIIKERDAIKRKIDFSALFKSWFESAKHRLNPKEEKFENEV